MSAVSVVNLQDFHAHFEFDPEHYHPARANALKAITSKSKVSDYVYEVTELVNSGINTTKSPVFDLTDAIGWFLLDGETPDEIKSSKKIAQSGDIVISRLRSYLEEVCLIPSRGKGFSPLLSTEFVVLRSLDNSHLGWLLPYLLCKPMQTILQWSQTGSNHPRFSSEMLLNLPVPTPVLKIRDRLNDLVKDAIEIFERGRTLYPQAEQELMERIGKPKEKQSELFFVEGFSNTLDEFRADAEYYQPKYKRLRKHLAKNSMKIGEFCPKPSRGIQPIFDSTGNVWVLASKSTRPQGVLLNEESRTRLEFYEEQQLSKALVSKGDVLLNSTGVGTLGRASFYLHENPAIADNHVAILKPNKKVCETAYLSLFLNSPAGIAQSEMFQTGSSGQLEIYSQHIQDILVFLPRNKDGSIDIAWQKKLSQKVIAASTANHDAQAKLEEGKRLIEKAIGK